MPWTVTRPYSDGRRRVHDGPRYLQEMTLPIDNKSIWGFGVAEGVAPVPREPALPEPMTLEEAIACADAHYPLATDRPGFWDGMQKAAATSPLVVNWWTDADLAALVTRLANETGIDVFGQWENLTREELIRELRGLCTAIAEADIRPVEFEGMDP